MVDISPTLRAPSRAGPHPAPELHGGDGEGPGEPRAAAPSSGAGCAPARDGARRVGEMSTIAFLEQLREDLLDAGWRESLPKGGRLRRGGRRFSGRWLVAAGGVVVLVAAGTIGWVVTDGGRALREQYAASGRPGTSPAP